MGILILNDGVSAWLRCVMRASERARVYGKQGAHGVEATGLDWSLYEAASSGMSLRLLS